MSSKPGNERQLGAALTMTMLVAAVSIASAQHWPQWRGPQGGGVTGESGLPLIWSGSQGVAWRSPLKGAGVSTPVVWGNRVFVTSQVGAGERRPGNHPTLVQGAAAADAGEKNLTGVAAGSHVTFSVSAFAWSNGAVEWHHDVPADGTLTGVHDKHNLATPSPAADADVVVAWFGTGQVVALDHGGKRLWTKQLARDYSPFEITWGHASSPVLYKDTVIFLCYHEPASFIVALDKRTGAVKWKADRGTGRLSYSTPVIVDTPAGAELIINSSAGLEAISPETGEARWHYTEESRFPIPVASAVGGMLYTTRGYRSGPFVAIRLGGRGDVGATHVAWRVPTGAPYVSSLVHHDGLIYTAGELGVVTCLDAKTGERVWQERAGGIFTASPIVGDGRIYLVSETGETVVLKAGRTFDVLARNKLDAHFVASPAVARGRIFLRGDTELFAIGR